MKLRIRLVLMALILAAGLLFPGVVRAQLMNGDPVADDPQLTSPVDLSNPVAPASTMATVSSNTKLTLNLRTSSATASVVLEDSPTGPGKFGPQPDVPGVPEPSTWAMLIAGLVGLALWRRRHISS